AEREEIRALAERARSVLHDRVRELEEAATVAEDRRLQERAVEHLSAGLPPSLALERIAAEFARTLASHGPAARRAVDVEAFLGGVAHRHAGLEPVRVRRGELIVAVHVSGLSALRAWASGAVGALCAGVADAAVLVQLDAEVPEQALVVAAQTAHAQRARVRAAQDVAEHRHARVAQLVDRSEVQDHFLSHVFLDQLALEKERAGGIEPAGDAEEDPPVRRLPLHGAQPVPCRGAGSRGRCPLCRSSGGATSTMSTNGLRAPPGPAR